MQLQRAMAAEAEAAREARAKVIAAEGEMKASRALKEASDVMAESPGALQLRYLQTLNSISAEKNSTIIFPLPLDILTPFLKPQHFMHHQYHGPLHPPTPMPPHLQFNRPEYAPNYVPPPQGAPNYAPPPQGAQNYAPPPQAAPPAQVAPPAQLAPAAPQSTAPPLSPQPQ